MWVLVKYEGKKFIGTAQKKVNGQYNVCCLEKPLPGINIPKKSKTNI